jgi:hypothetical protein
MSKSIEKGMTVEDFIALQSVSRGYQIAREKQQEALDAMKEAQEAYEQLILSLIESNREPVERNR